MAEKTLERYALHYLSLGWSVIPVRPREKRPAVRWLAYQKERASENDVVAWFRRWPDANVGIVTGKLSGLVALDVDPKYGGDESLRSLEKQHGSMPKTLESITGGGGRHLYFRHPGGLIRNRVGLRPGIDFRGDGGYLVAPPSVHASGRTYRWAPDHEPEKTNAAVLPDYLLWELSTGDGHPGHPISYWRHLVAEGVSEGRRNKTIASLAGHLLWRGVDTEVTLELLLCWNRIRCHPPLREEEVVRTLESIIRLHQEQRDRVETRKDPEA